MSTKRRSEEDGVPLLSRENRDDRVVFALDDEYDDDDTPLAYQTRLDNRSREGGDEAVGYAVGPPLRSTVRSRETEFELDTDDIEDAIPPPTSNTFQAPRSAPNDMPLLVGLMQSGTRRSLDLPLQTNFRPEDDMDMPPGTFKDIGGGLLESVANMANSILGAGIIGLPYAIKEAGFFTGIFLLIALCAATDWTIRLIVVNAKLSGRNSYIGIMDHCFGPAGRAAVSFFQFAFAFGGMCAFGVIIGDTIPHVIRSIFPRLGSMPFLFIFANRSFIVALCTICVSYPLSLYRDISKLARASGFALVGMLIIVFSVVMEGERVSPDLKGDPKSRFSFIQPQIFQAIGVISFAFVCHHNSLLIYGSLKTPTLDRFAMVTHASTALSLLFCLLLGISGFVVFTDKTQGNILNNFSPNDTIINIARFCFGLNMFTTLPLELFVCREVIEQYFYEHEPFNHHRHIILTTCILFGSTFLSTMTCDLGIMLEITGGVSATALAYIFPAVCFLKLTGPTPHPNSLGNSSRGANGWLKRSRVAAMLCAAFGALVLVLSVILSLKKAMTEDGGERVCM